MKRTATEDLIVTRGRDYFGTHRLVRLIRAGHTCNVWETVNENDGNRYAIKVLKPEEKDNSVEVRALKNEFEIGQKLKHPNIIRIYELNREGGILYLVMELFPATNLKIMLRQGSERLFPIVKDIVEQAADALYYFHSQGFVHRDVKPDNFLVSEQGVVKLIDFAICIRQVSGLGKLFTNWFANVQGTRSYMSPEQIRNQSLDPRADVYSFGCVLFELVTGRAPFTGDSPTDLLSKHLSAPPPSAQVWCPNLAPEFADLIRKMMAKNRDSRPANMWEFLKEFRQVRLFKELPKKKKPEEETEA